MKSKFKIFILGIGGTGGYIGGKLAAGLIGSRQAEIIFIARGENEKAIRQNGLKLTVCGKEQLIHPSAVTSQPGQAGIADLVICCVKSYDLETALASLKPCIGRKTIILPLLNGIDAASRIRDMFPQAEVWDGCIYIVSKLVAPGVVGVSGNLNKLFFGAMHETEDKLKYVETIFSSAGLNAHRSANIMLSMWEKFLFISPLATCTSFLNLPVGDIRNNTRSREILLHLLYELKELAMAKGIPLAENIVEKIMDKFASLPADTTSSMHRDFKDGKKTEINSLTTYVISLGKELGIPTPYYEKAHAGLVEKLFKKNIVV